MWPHRLPALACRWWRAVGVGACATRKPRFASPFATRAALPPPAARFASPLTVTPASAEGLAIAGGAPEASALGPCLRGEFGDEGGVVGLGRIGKGARRAARGEHRLQEPAVRQPDAPQLPPEAVDVTAALMSRPHDRARGQQVL